MKQLLAIATIVALLGLPLAAWADPDEHYQYFEPELAKAEASVSTDRAAEEAVFVLTSGEESDSEATKGAEKPRESGGDETFIMW